MNILRLVTYSTNVKLTENQLSKCKDNECFAYISPNEIGVTTCGTRITTDNVFPQKPQYTKIVMYHNQPMAEVYGEIDNQQVIAITSKELINRQHLFSWCAKVKKEEGLTEYSECKHIKLVVSDHSIHIAN